MRFWVVLAGVAIALSGCIGGHVTGKPRDDNATADASDTSGDALDEAPPWALEGGNGTQDGAQKDGVTSGGKGSPKDSGAGSGSQGGGSGADDPSGDPSDDPSGGGGSDDEPDPLGNVTDDVATEGAKGVGDVVEDADDGVDRTRDETDTDVSKDPLGGLVGVIGSLLG